MANRIPNDNYPTPAVEVERGLRRLAIEHPDFQPRTMLEPGAGRAPFCTMAREISPSIKRSTGVDIRRLRMRGADEGLVTDFLKWKSNRRFDLVATNPPFRWAEQFTIKALETLAPGGLGLFLPKLDFLGSEGRRKRLWNTDGLRAVWVVPWRTKFVEPNTDTSYHAWFLFDPRFAGDPTLSWIDVGAP